MVVLQEVLQFALGRHKWPVVIFVVLDYSLFRDFLHRNSDNSRRSLAHALSSSARDFLLLDFFLL